MNIDNSSSATWQKIATIVAVLIILIPVVFKYSWNVLFPKNYLLFEVNPIIDTKDVSTANISVFNAGSNTQRNVFLYLPAKFSSSDEKTYIEITPSARRSLNSVVSFDPEIDISEFSQRSGFKISLGTIRPESETQVSFVKYRSDSPYSPRLSLHGLRIESDSAVAIEADGQRRPRFSDTAHDFYTDISPFLLAMFITIFFGLFLVGLIHDVFFDTPHKKMARKWKEMDAIQEEIEKERRYQ